MRLDFYGFLWLSNSLKTLDVGASPHAHSQWAAGTEEESTDTHRLSTGDSSHNCRKVSDSDVPCLASFCDWKRQDSPSEILPHLPGEQRGIIVTVQCLLFEACWGTIIMEEFIDNPKNKSLQISVFTALSPFLTRWHVRCNGRY